MTKQTPSSKTQDRILALMDLDSDGTYSHAARILQSVDLPADGMVASLSARQIKGLSDNQLRDRLPAVSQPADYPSTTAQLVADQDQARRDAKAARKARVRTNDLLRARGFRWVKTGSDHADNIHPRDLDSMAAHDIGVASWTLLDPDGNPTSVDAALAASG